MLSSDGPSSQPIWLDNVQCSNSDSSKGSCLAYCESCPSSQYHDCSHTEDISLRCGKLNMLIFDLSTDFTSIPATGPYATLDTCRYADSGTIFAAVRGSHINP